MKELQLTAEKLPTLATNCVLVGHAQKADVIWTRDEFLTICHHMLNGNPPTDFLLIYRDRQNIARFAKAKKAQAGRRATWSWDTITGRARSKVGIGFYPSNARGETRWGAMDFDAHDGNALRARGLALAAFDLLHRQPQLYVVLGTSGSEGWHLFAFTGDFHPVADWTRLLRQVAAKIGAEVSKGICEIFPSEVEQGALPYGIRAPGTWNPKTDALGAIAFSSLAPLLSRSKEKEEESVFLYHSTTRVKGRVKNDREQIALYRGTADDWKARFAITKQATRAEQLKALVMHIFRQVGRETALANARLQFAEKSVSTEATAAEHASEFASLWQWASDQWLAELSTRERDKLAKLQSEPQREVFRIARNFARQAQAEGREDFPLPVEHVGDRIGKRFQTVAQIRKRFTELQIIEMTVPCKANESAAHYAWIADAVIDQPF